jgi:hypothetical protein
MQSILFVTALLAFTAASPISKPPGVVPLPLVSINLIGSPSHYSVGPVQHPQSQSASSNAWSISIPLDVSIDLSTRPEHVQAIEISSVEAGVDMQGSRVRSDDVGVKCKAGWEWGSGGVVVGMGERVVLDEGKMVRVTGVSCWKECA